jgi:hypothetical protein
MGRRKHVERWNGLKELLVESSIGSLNRRLRIYKLNMQVKILKTRKVRVMKLIMMKRVNDH